VERRREKTCSDWCSASSPVWDMLKQHWRYFSMILLMLIRVNITLLL